MGQKSTLGALVGLIWVIAGCMGFGDVDPNGETVVSYETDVKPLLEAKCLDCHGDPPVGGTITFNRESSATQYAAAIHARAVIMQDMPPGMPLNYDEKLILDTWIRAVLSVPEESMSDVSDTTGEGGMAGVMDIDGTLGEAGRDESIETARNDAGTVGSLEEGEAGSDNVSEESATDSEDITSGTAGADMPMSEPEPEPEPMLEPLPDDINWNDHIAPIFSLECTNCHGAMGGIKNLNLTSYDGASMGGLVYGRLLDTDDPDNSILIDYLRARNGLPVMPPTGQLQERTIMLVEAWLRSGAPQTGTP